MARVTVEDCLRNVDNMYELVHLATKRSRQIYKGSEHMVVLTATSLVMSLTSSLLM